MKAITSEAQDDLIKLHSGNPWVELLDIEMPVDFTPQDSPVNEYRFMNRDPLGRWHILLTNAFQNVCQPANGWKSARLADDELSSVDDWRTFFSVPYTRDETQDSDENGLIAARIALGDASGVISSIMKRTAGMIGLRARMELAMAGRYTVGAYAVVGEDTFLLDDDVDVATTSGSAHCPGNYAIVNGMLYLVTMEDGLPVMTQVGESDKWTMVDGLYDPDETRASVYGICDSKLYAVVEATEELISESSGWERVYGRLGWAGAEYAIAIKDGSLFVIDGNTTPEPFGATGGWTAISGGIFEQNGNKLNYLAIRDGGLYKIWLPYGSPINTELVDSGPGWQFVVGSFDPENPYYAAYGVKNGELYRITSAGVTLLDSGNGAWTCLKGSMIKNNICGVIGIRDGNLVMSVGDPEYFKIMVDSSRTWTDAYCNEQIGVFFAYAIGDGELFGVDLLLETGEEGYYYYPVVQRIGSDGGWIKTGAQGDKVEGNWGAVNISLRRMAGTTGGEEVFGNDFLSCLESEVIHDFQVVRSSHDRTRFNIELSSHTPMDRRFPPRVMLKATCQWAFRGPECGYDGEEITCNRTIADCRARNNILRIGCFPGCGSGGLAQ